MENRGIRYFIHHLVEVDSTNRYINDEAPSLWDIAGDADALVVTADLQTAGRGQRGNIWCSETGENLLVSILVRPEFLPVKEQFLLSQITALAVKGCMKYFGIDVSLKWPNDIYIGKRKLCGMLLELQFSATTIEQAIIGVGININQATFPVIDRTPVSMYQLMGRRYNINDVLDALLVNFSKYYMMLFTGNVQTIVDEYKNSLLGMGATMNYRDKDGNFDATIVEVENDGHLLLQRKNGNISRYAFKEVELLL